MTFTWAIPIRWPEHDASWTLDCLTRVGDLLAAHPTGPGLIELEWSLGGFEEEPDWVGPGQPRGRGARVEFNVGLPRALQDDDLETRILDFAASAVGVATDRLTAAAVAFDRIGHEQAIAAARAAVAALGPAGERRQPFRATEERWLRRKATQEALARGARRYPDRAPGPALPSLEFAYRTPAEVDALFDFEAAADAALLDAGLGSVDGNEVGQGAYTLFIDPTRGKRTDAIATVKRIAAERGLVPRLKAR